MPQSSIAYAVGCVRAPSRRPLGKAELERLMSAQGYEEARRQLSDMGYGGGQEEDISVLSAKALEDACAYLRRITPDPALTDAFLLRYDAQNLKTLLKARIMGETPEALSGCGTIPPDTLRHAVAERVYRNLPLPFKEAMEGLEKSLALDVNPMEIDARIDRAAYSLMLARVKESQSQTAREYFSRKADLQNAVTTLRLRSLRGLHMKPEELYLPGGKIKKWPEAIELTEKLPKLFTSWPNGVREAVSRASRDASQIPALEKAAEDYLLDMWRPFRHEPFAVEVLIGWLLAHERAAQAVRLIMAAKLNGFSEEAVRERLREAYGQ